MDTNVLREFMYLFSTVKNFGTNSILLLIYINIVACNVRHQSVIRFVWAIPITKLEVKCAIYLNSVEKLPL